MQKWPGDYHNTVIKLVRMLQAVIFKCLIKQKLQFSNLIQNNVLIQNRRLLNVRINLAKTRTKVESLAKAMSRKAGMQHKTKKIWKNNSQKKSQMESDANHRSEQTVSQQQRSLGDTECGQFVEDALQVGRIGIPVSAGEHSFLCLVEKNCKVTKIAASLFSWFKIRAQKNKRKWLLNSLLNSINWKIFW